MPSIINFILAMIVCIAMATASTIPQDTSAAKMLETRADMETCPGVNGKSVRGNRFKVYCNRDTEFDSERMVTVQAADFDDCMGKCEGTYRGWCRRASWGGMVNEPGTCYIKGTGTGDIDGRNRPGWKLGRRY